MVPLLCNSSQTIDNLYLYLYYICTKHTEVLYIYLTLLTYWHTAVNLQTAKRLGSHTSHLTQPLDVAVFGKPYFTLLYEV